jgi:Ni/Co efflux regulator RcnB
MKTLLNSVFALTLFAGLPALAAPADHPNTKLAQRDDEQGRQRGGGEQRGNQGQQGQNRGPQGENRGQAEPPRGGPRTGAPPPTQAAPAQRPQNDRGQARGPAQAARGRPNARQPVEHGPSQYEKRAFQRNVTASRRFRVGAFRPPQGWRYQRWTFGQILPRPFWAQPYWITNFWLYDLDRPPTGCEWVRSGPDALLVDTVTGEILETEYNVFY